MSAQDKTALDAETPEGASFAADSVQAVKDGKQKRKTKADRERDDLRAVLALPEGRRVLRRLLKRADPFASSFASDAGLMAFKEGHRNMGLMLVSMIADADAKALAEVLVEMGGRDD